MKKILITGGVILGLVLIGYFTLFSEKKQDIKVLVFSKTEGFRHASIETGTEALKKLGDTNGFIVEASEDATVFNEAYLKDFHVIIFLNTTGDILDAFQQVEVERFIQAGGGFVGIHAAADTEYAWPWYGKMVGGYFESHPNNPNVLEAVLDVVNPNHPATDSIPERWKRMDEWYNYKSLNTETNVLIKLDESTYEGGTNGDNHPMSWYHDYDGGRAFYTGLGHTDESYSDPLFLKHILGGIKYAIGNGVPVNYENAYAEVMPEENRFTKLVFDQNLNEPMELDFLDDNRIIFVERRGDVKIHNLENGETKVIAHQEVFSELEDGLLGVAVDPNYNQNNWIYFFYSPVGEEPKQHVSRFKLEGENLIAESERVLLEIPTQRDECCHSAGSLEFGPDGNLFISVGDNTNPHASGGYGPMDEREGRSAWDAQKSASNANDFRGKILRITPTDDGSYAIPEGNLFSKDSKEAKPEIYVMGCRNPYRISIDAKTKYLYWGDVGPDANDDSVSRGPRGHDEVNQAKGAGFFGWPYFVGNSKPYHEFNFETEVPGKAFDPEKPFNDSPNNTGLRDLPPAQKAFIWYPYDNSEEFPMLGSGARNAMAGPVFYGDQFPDNDHKYPDYFEGKLIVYDWMRQWMYLATMKENGDLEKLTQFVPNMKFNNVIDMMYGPDGSIYLLEYGTAWFSQNPDARLVKIEYTAGNRKPIAKIEANKTIGGTPLTVKFNGNNSVDFDGDPLTFEWIFEGDETVQSTEPSPSFTFEKSGVYKTQLTVTDKEGEKSTSAIEIMVGNELPVVNWSFSGGDNSFYLEGNPLVFNYEVAVTDAEDGTIGNGIDPAKVIVTIDFLPEGLDFTESAQGHQALADASSSMVGKGLIGDSDCMACHQEAAKSIGPSFKDIATKYNGDNSATKTLAGKVINGGGGVWGETAMAAHPALSDGDAEKMVKYILSFSENKAVKGLPYKGKFEGKDHIGNGENGAYVLTASYTDNGGGEVGPLVARETIIIRGPKTEAENYDNGIKAMKFSVKAADTPGVDEDMTIIIGAKGAHYMFKDFTLDGVTSFVGRFGLAPQYTKGGVVEIRTGGVNGDLIGKWELEQGLTTFGIEEYTAKVKPTSGKHDLYFVFKNDEEDGDVMVSFMDWFKIKKENAQ